MSLDDKLGGAGKFARFGKGNFIKDLPPLHTIRYSDFSGGYVNSDSPEDAPANTNVGGADVETDRKDRIIRAPGTAAFETLTGHSPTQLAIHASLDFRSELVVFDAPDIGFKKEGATTWVANALASDINKGNWFYATYGEDFFFSCGTERTFKHRFGSNTVQPSTVPAGKDFAVWAGRFWVGGALIEGGLEPLGVDWSGVNSAEDRDPDNGQGAELLIQDAGIGDEIVALRPMGFDLMAILMRRSIWVARRTGDAVRPADFFPRVTGEGCVAKRTARTVNGGVIYLADSGVKLFDGNQTVEISSAINAEILPLDAAKLARYGGGYNPHTQRYYLLVPDVGTYVYDLQKKSWSKRTLLAEDVVPFAEQFHATTWAEAVGTWAANAGTPWAGMAPTESSPPDMVFLGQSASLVWYLEKESYAATLNFGKVLAPLWITPVLQQDAELGLFTTREVRITYFGGGSVIGIWQKNIEGQLVKTHDVTLPSSVDTITRKSNLIWTGKGAGLGISFISGLTTLSRLELEVRVRGRRITNPLVIAPPAAAIVGGPVESVLNFQGPDNTVFLGANLQGPLADATIAWQTTARRYCRRISVAEGTSKGHDYNVGIEPLCLVDPLYPATNIIARVRDEVLVGLVDTATYRRSKFSMLVGFPNGDTSALTAQPKSCAGFRAIRAVAAFDIPTWKAYYSSIDGTIVQEVDTTILVTSPHLLEVVFDGRTRTIRWLVDGVEKATYSPTSGTAPGRYAAGNTDAARVVYASALDLITSNFANTATFDFGAAGMPRLTYEFSDA